MPEANVGIAVTSSLEPELPEGQQRVYRETLELLGTHRVPFAVSGAFAFQHHTGIWRATKDLDLCMTSDAAARALDLLEREGYRCEVCDAVWLAKAHRDGHFVDLITGMSNAALNVTDVWITRATRGAVLGVSTLILSAEELLASKLFVARRERFDGADIAHIVYATRGNLDWTRVLELAGHHWEVLLWSLLLFRYVYPAQSMYVPLLVWAELVNGLMFRLVNRDSAARFRGSLVDEKMFAIDVNEWGLDDLFSEYRACRADKIEWQPRGLDPHKNVA